MIVSTYTPDEALDATDTSRQSRYERSYWDTTRACWIASPTTICRNQSSCLHASSFTEPRRPIVCSQLYFRQNGQRPRSGEFASPKGRPRIFWGTIWFEWMGNGSSEISPGSTAASVKYTPCPDTFSFFSLQHSTSQQKGGLDPQDRLHITRTSRSRCRLS